MPTAPLTLQDRPWTRRWLVFAVALLVRGIYLYLIRDNPFFDSPIIDAQTYDEQAREIARGALTGGEVFWQPPLYPYLLGLIYTIIGRDLVWVRVLQALLSALTCVLASELAARRFGARAGGWTGLLLSFYAPVLFYTGELLVPVLSLPLDLAVLLALTPPAERPLASRRLAAAGLFLGLSAVARPTILFFLPPLAFWLLLPARGGSRHRRVQRLALLVGLTALPILPATLHNRVVGQSWVLVSSNGGINFYLGNNARYEEALAIRPGIAWKTLMLEPESHGATTPAAASGFWSHKAWDFILTHPVDALLLLLKKTWLLFQAYELPRNLDYNFFADRYAPLLKFLIQFGALLPLALVGLWTTRRTPGQTVWRVFLVANALSIVAFFVVARYRMTLVPLLAVYAGATLESAYQHLRARATRSAIGTSLAGIGLALLIQLDPFQVAKIDASEGMNLVGKAHSNVNRHHEAIHAFRQALELNPSYIDVHFNLAREYQIEQRCDLAIPYYKTALRAFPRDRDTLNNLAVCHIASGQTAEGIALLQQVATYHPAIPDLYYNLAQAYQGDGQLELARHTLELGLRRVSDGKRLRAALADVTQRIERRDQLEAARQKARTAGEPVALSSAPVPERAKALNNEGHRLLVQGDLPGALARFQEAILESPVYATAWSNLGQGFYLAGRFSEARTAFETALEASPGYAKARMGLALTLANGFQDVAGARALLTAVAGQASGLEAAQARELLRNLPEK